MDDELAASWIVYTKSHRDDLLDADMQLYRILRSDPARAWLVILKMAELAGDDLDLLGIIGAGPLEDLVRWHPTPWLDRAAAEAVTNAAFAQALRVTRYPGHD